MASASSRKEILLGIASVQDVASAFDRGYFVTGHSRRDAAVDAIGEHPLERARKQLLALEAGRLLLQGLMQP